MSHTQSAVDTAPLRALLDSTGHLATRTDDDPGHISDFWRRRIVTLLDALDGGAVTSGVVAPVDVDQVQIDSLLESARQALHGHVDAKWTRACFLIREAVPRMRTLNNAHSTRWLAMADAFFSGDAS